MALQLTTLGGTDFMPFFHEHKFCPNRKWSIDFYVPARKLGIEVEGGTWTAGRHNRGSGFEKDCEKYLAAHDHGITVIRVTGKMVKDGTAIKAIGRFLQSTSSASPAKSPCHALPKKVRRTVAATSRASAASGRGKKPSRPRRRRGQEDPAAKSNRRPQGT